MNSIQVFAVLLLLLLREVASKDNLNYSPFNCGSDAWELNYTDHHEMRRRFNEWIFAWQFACDWKRNGISHESAGNGGIGSAVMFESKYFMKTIELNAIYRPLHTNFPYWLWADRNASVCTLGIQSYDCYFEPTSDCGLNVPRTAQLEQQIKEVIEEKHALDFMAENYAKYRGNMDICGMAKKMRKSVKWVHAQLVMYLSRPRPDLKAEIQSKKHAVFHGIPKQGLTIGIQLRGGEPDNGRIALNNISSIMQTIDIFVARVEKERNTPVAMVFFCSNLPEENYISAEYMTAAYPRHYVYRAFNHTELGKGEFELILQAASNSYADKRFSLMVDFYADVEIMAECDYIIGSNSNVYMVAALYRAGRREHAHWPQNTCYISPTAGGNRIICEGSAEHKALYDFYFSPKYTHFENE